MNTSPIGADWRAFPVTHEEVCDRCGHGESLHVRDLSCIACDQRMSAGLPSSCCTGFLAERPEAVASHWASDDEAAR